MRLRIRGEVMKSRAPKSHKLTKSRVDSIHTEISTHACHDARRSRVRLYTGHAGARSERHARAVFSPRRHTRPKPPRAVVPAQLPAQLVHVDRLVEVGILLADLEETRPRCRAAAGAQLPAQLVHVERHLVEVGVLLADLEETLPRRRASARFMSHAFPRRTPAPAA